MDEDMKSLSPEEAAKVLEDMKVKIEIPKAAVTQWKRNTALDMAIEALKYSGVPNSSDSISRRLAVDKLKERLIETASNNVGIMRNVDEVLVDVAEERLENWFEEVPPAQPEVTHCVECIHWKHSAVRKSYCEAFDWMSKAEDFCSFAERRTDD